MNVEEKAKIVAMASLLGVEGNDTEIFQKYSDFYKQAYATFNNELPKENSVTLINRQY